MRDLNSEYSVAMDSATLDYFEAGKKKEKYDNSEASVLFSCVFEQVYAYLPMIDIINKKYI